LCQSGLSKACLQSSHTLAEVDQKIRRYLELHLPGLKGKAVLAGNSVYADKMFLVSC
jgi:oligoribonuclease (3'-5' exoribonuclease)